MKINPINNTENTVFKGLWEHPQERITSVDEYSTTKNINFNYHPFKNESPSDISRALKYKNFTTTCPNENDFEYMYIISEGKKSKTLSFTEGDYKAYKSFYGKNLPEKFANIEKELVENCLGKYLNRGYMYKIRQFLHNIIKK